jgi:hypothetical protein
MSRHAYKCKRMDYIAPWPNNGYYYFTKDGKGVDKSKGTKLKCGR